MTVVLLLTAAVLLSWSAAHTTAFPTQQPTTYRPPWSTTTRAFPPSAATQESVQLEGGLQQGASEPASRDQSLKRDASIPSEAASSGTNISWVDSMVLKLEMYEGQPRLVYRLAPGSIFAGVKTPLHNDREWRSTSGGGKPNKKYSSGPGGRLRKPIQSERMPPEKGVVAAPWVTSPLVMHSLKHPLPAPRRPPHRGITLSGLRANLASLSTAGLGAIRSVRLIFMILQYLGFLPHFPGLPKYEDPALLRSSTHYTLPRDDAEVL